jgi:pheromone shutdown protein TraB
MSAIYIGSETLLNRASGTCHGECNRYRSFRLISLKNSFVVVVVVVVVVVAPYDTNKYKHCVQWFYSASSLSFCAASLFATEFGHICRLGLLICFMSDLS